MASSHTSADPAWWQGDPEGVLSRGRSLSMQQLSTGLSTGVDKVRPLPKDWRREHPKTSGTTQSVMAKKNSDRLA